MNEAYIAELSASVAVIVGLLCPEEMVNDTRNWKCFFGMHQWQLKEKREQHYYEYSSSKDHTKLGLYCECNALIAESSNHK